MLLVLNLMVNSQKTGCLAMKVNLNVILDAIEMADDNYTRCV